MPEPIDDLDRRIAEALATSGPRANRSRLPRPGCGRASRMRSPTSPATPAEFRTTGVRRAGGAPGRRADPPTPPAPGLNRWAALAAAVLVILALAGVLAPPLPRR